MDEELGREQEPGNIFVRELFDWVESCITAIVFVILLFTFVGRMVGVFGESMLPTLSHQDRLVAFDLFYKPKSGDIVVVTQPNDRNEPLVKRVIATGGQSLEVDAETNSVIVDGNRIDEPYILEPMDPRIRSDLEYPVTVPEGHVFVMGDNRNNSWDSRRTSVGFVDERYILGKVIYRVMPYKNLGVPR